MDALRPPGARAKAEYESLCIRCARCMAICPYGSLVGASWQAGRGAGAPVVFARKMPCYLCMLCPPVCPSGALQAVADATAVRMGVAVVEPSRCYAFMGVLCRTCVDECPLQEAAIHQDDDLRPNVTDGCVGCGVCEHVCPAPQSAIHVIPR